MREQFGPLEKKSSTGLILSAGFLVGTLDILSAFVDYYIATGNNPLFVLKYIASGAFGESAFTGGSGMMLIGLVFHYCFAFFFTILFFWLYPRIDFLSRNKIITGIVYGIFIWMIMNLVVVQLCKAPHASIREMKAEKILKSAVILIVMIGLPLSFIAGKYYLNNPGKLQRQDKI